MQNFPSFHVTNKNLYLYLKVNLLTDFLTDFHLFNNTYSLIKLPYQTQLNKKHPISTKSSYLYKKQFFPDRIQQVIKDLCTATLYFRFDRIFNTHVMFYLFISTQLLLFSHF